jgi:hypothetical protein
MRTIIPKRRPTATDPKMVEILEFTCPRCGSHMFGTSGRLDWSSAIGECHGPNRCRFQWRRRDDAKYFKGTGRYHLTILRGFRLR